MALVDITEVIPVKVDTEHLWGRAVDLPKVGDQSGVYAVVIEGWVLGRETPVTAVEVLHNRTLVRRVPVNGPRPDVAAAYDHVSDAQDCGFRTIVSVEGMEQQFELCLQAVLQQDQPRVPIGVIRARRRPTHSNFRPKLQPLMLTSLGRSGSTWVIQLLGSHPQVVTYRPFQYEPRMASYWMQVVKALSEPASYFQTLAASSADEYWWLGTKTPTDELRLARPLDPRIHQWLGRDSVEALIGFAQSRIEAFYEQVATLQGAADPIYFAEKFLPNAALGMMWEVYPHAREVILVRDFRDVFYSIAAYSAKNKNATFGRARASSDEEYARQLQDSAVRLLQSWKQRMDRAFLLRYEDLIQRPAEMLGTVLDYLGLGADSAVVEQTLQSASERLPEAQRWHQTSGDPAASIGRWRREADPALRAVFREVFDDVLRDFGYDPDADEPD